MGNELKPCHACGGDAHLMRNSNIFSGQDYGDRYPENVRRQRHGYRVECYNRCLMTCWWHYESEAAEAWNTRPQPAGECGELVERLSAVAEGHRSMIGLHSDKLPLLEALEDAITALSRPLPPSVWCVPMEP